MRCCRAGLNINAANYVSERRSHFTARVRERVMMVETRLRVWIIELALGVTTLWMDILRNAFRA